MRAVPHNTYRFGDFRLDASERAFSNCERAIQLSPRIFDTLVLLVQNAGHVLSKKEMLDEIWADTVVEENNLAQSVSTLRRVLGETPETRFIETVPGFGYRFVAQVNADDPPVVKTEIFERTRARIFIDCDEQNRANPTWNLRPTLAGCSPETRYLQNGDVNISYQVIGDGPIDIVFVMGWVSHLEYFWKYPASAAFLERLASFSRLILFDQRGTGLSDRVSIAQLPSLEQRVDDVRAVMDAVGAKRAVLCGLSEGGPICSLFAATFPERAKAVVMLGSYAKCLKENDYPWAPSSHQWQDFFGKLQREWGGPVDIERVAPSMIGDPEFRMWWAEYLRMGASPGAAVALAKMNSEIDVRDVLPCVRVPTLVIHRKDDACVSVEEGRFAASLIPGSKYVELEGGDHLPYIGDQDALIDEIENFVADTRFADSEDLVLATVVNVKIAVGGNIGIHENDQQTKLFERTRDKIRLLLDAFKGKLVSYDMDGIVAAFDAPGRAIRCARAITASIDRPEVEVRTGVHTGECAVSGDNYCGFALEAARKIANESEKGSILVSGTVRDLIAGSELSFSEYAERSFPGIQGEWKLFELRESS